MKRVARLASCTGTLTPSRCLPILVLSTLYLAHAFRWFSMNDRLGADYSGNTPRKNIDYPTPDGYDLFLGLKTLANINEKLLKDQVPYWKDFRDHPNYDAFWQARDVRRSLRNVRPAVLNVGGWFDAEDLFGTLGTFRGVEAAGSAVHGSTAAGIGMPARRWERSTSAPRPRSSIGRRSSSRSFSIF